MASKKTSKTKPAAKSKSSSKKPIKKSAKPAKKAKKPASKTAKKPVKKTASKPVKKAIKKAKPQKKKAVSKAKSKPVAKKKAKPALKAKAKSRPKPAKKKVSAKKPAKKVVSKKLVKKKVVKRPLKKVAPKKKAKKVTKKSTPLKKKKAVKILKKKAPAKKVAAKIKPKKTAKPLKVVAKKPLKSSAPLPKGKSLKTIAVEKEKVKEKAGRRKSKKSLGDDDEPKIDELDPIVEELISTKKKGKVPKVPKVPSPIKLMPTVKIEAAEKEHVIPKNFRNGGKEKFEMEFYIKSSPRILYNFISSPSGLSEWFSDDVNIKNGIYSFFWEDSMEQAKLLATREFELMRFKWVATDEDDTYFEMRIKIDELTGDVALIITDFAKKEELEESQMLWESQIQGLCKALGS